MNYIFVNKNKRIKDMHICTTYSKNYFKILLITKLLTSTQYSIEYSLIYLIILKNQQLLLNKYKYKSYHKNISFLSGRTRSVFTEYGIARTDFKKLMILHQIPNLKKANW